MKILKEGITPEGVYIRVEDWSEDYPGTYAYGEMLAAYPRRYAHIRCEANCGKHAHALLMFEKLLDGSCGIFDIAFTVMRSGGYRVPITEVIDREKYEKLTRAN